MSILSRVLSAEGRTTLANPSQWLVDALTGGETYAGKKVTVSSSLGLVPVFGVVSLISGAVATVPCIVYRDLGEDRRERARDTRQWEILHEQPNEEMASDEFFEIVQAHLLTWGNAAIEKVYDKAGRIDQLWPIEPERCQYGRVDGRKTIFVDAKPYSEAKILHVRGLGKAGLVGYSPIQMAKQQLAVLLAQEEFAGAFWKNGTFIGGFLEHPQELSDEASKRLQRLWRSKNAGVSKAGRVPILEEGMKYTPTTMPLKDAQFIEQAKFGDLRVAQLFGLVPPHRWGNDGESMTYQNSEVGATEFVRWTLMRWLRRMEGSFKRDPEIFPPSLPIFPEFLADALMRGTTKERFDAYAIGVKNHFLLPDEARAGENRPPLPDGMGQEFPGAVQPEEPPIDDVDDDD